MNALILKAAEFHLNRPAPPAFIDILAELEQPQIMLVASGQEEFEHRVSQNYAGVIGPNEAIWLIENAQHVGGPTAVPDEYRERMLAFFAASFEK
jgi:hypothetical protein